jgi:hypothetical protein
MANMFFLRDKIFCLTWLSEIYFFLDLAAVLGAKSFFSAFGLFDILSGTTMYSFDD